MAPKLNRRRALFVLAKIDEILSWEKTIDRERDSRFVELGRYLCEVRSGQYWRLDNLRSFDEFLEKEVPGIAPQGLLPDGHPRASAANSQAGASGGGMDQGDGAGESRAAGTGQRFECATWLHKARAMPKEEFKREVDRHLTGKETEPWEIIYFKLYKSQLPVIEQALETAALMLGTGQIARAIVWR